MRKVFAFLLLAAVAAMAQQPQAQPGTPAFPANATWANGVAPGYAPTAGSGLTLDVSAGTAFCGGSIITYSGGTLSMTASTTNNVYLNTSSSCAPAVKTGAFTAADIPIAQVATSGSAITAIADVRTMMFPAGTGGGGLGDPGANGIVERTALNTTAPATAHNVSATLNCADTSGSGTAQSCTTTPSFTPASGDCLVYTTTTTNSGTGLTANINSLGAKSIAIAGSSGWTTTLTASIIPANKPLLICYDGTNWDAQQTGTVSAGSGSSPYFLSQSTSTTLSSAAFQSFPNCGVVAVPNGASSPTLTLPATMPAALTCVKVISHDGSGNIVEVSPNTGHTIDGFGSGDGVGLFAGASITLLSDGTSNYISETNPGFYPSSAFPFSGPSLCIGCNLNHGTGLGTNSIYVGPVGAPNETGGGNAFVGSAGTGGSMTTGQYDTYFGVGVCASCSTNNWTTVVGDSGCSNGNGCGPGTFLGAWTARNAGSYGNNLLLINDGTNASGGAEAPSGYNNYTNIVNWLFADSAKGHVVWGANSGNGTSIASNQCGTTTQGTVKTGSNDTWGAINVGGTGVTSCVVSFGGSWTTTAPDCQITVEGVGVGVYPTETTTALTIHATSGIDGLKINYQCAKETVAVDGSTSGQVPVP